MKELYVFCGNFGVFNLSEDLSEDRKEFKNLDDLIKSLKPYYESGKYSLVAKYFPSEDLEIFKMELGEKYPYFSITTRSKRDKD